MIFHLYVGGSANTIDNMIEGNFNDITFLSDSLETLAHYYDGGAAIVTIDLDMDCMMQYTRNSNVDKNYTWGYVEMNCPNNANWFSVGKNYIKSHEYNISKMPVSIINAILKHYDE